MSRLRRCAIHSAAALLAAFALASCSVIQEGAGVLEGMGKISASDRQAIVKTAQAVRSTFAEITEEEEYYIGRAVSALILSQYKVYGDPAFTKYLNTLGTAVAYASDRPEIYAGYHFLCLDSDEVNAMAAPGGFVFVTRGLVRRCANEEMLAAVLAHEIGHVASRHGLQSIKKSRLVDAFQVIGTEAAKKYGSEELQKLTSLFEGALGDIVESLVERGYDRKYEYEADELALAFASRTGYDPHGLEAFLGTLAGEAAEGGPKGWFKTHPAPADRLQRVKSGIAGLGQVPETEPVRTQRFTQASKGLR